MFWVNGYQYGKYVPHIGPQTKFPIPPGILNTQGENHLAVSIWNQQEEDITLGIGWLVYGVYESGFEMKMADTEYLRPSWKKGREVYA